MLHNEQSLMPTRYSYTDVVAMTNNFEDKLGLQGGLGSVYKGQLPDGCLIVVKMLENSRFRGTEKLVEFVTPMFFSWWDSVLKAISRLSSV